MENLTKITYNISDVEKRYETLPEVLNLNKYTGEITVKLCENMTREGEVRLISIGDEVNEATVIDKLKYYEKLMLDICNDYRNDKDIDDRLLPYVLRDIDFYGTETGGYDE